MSGMTFDDILAKKRYGIELTREEIQYFISQLTENAIADYKVSAFLMAICLQGMTDRETFDLTDAMAKSGDELDLSVFGEKTVDKHSTGGVGDKTTLIVAPIAACAGCKIAKMSGRGLGDTGGTIDKLESVPGFSVELSHQQFLQQVEEIGVAVISQSGDLAPADKKLYALRDVTCTVDSIPLIASSIMSKKLAAGAQHIVLDVKCGSGAFMKELSQAQRLAESMIDIGKRKGRSVRALITDMQTPLGSCVGNALEVMEAASILQGKTEGDALTEVCLALAGMMISSAFGEPFARGRQQALQILESGAAYQKLIQWLTKQGGDRTVCENLDNLRLSSLSYELCAESSGYLFGIDAARTGHLAKQLGAGRENKGDPIDYGAGIRFLVKPGDRVTKGKPLAILYTEKEITRARLAQIQQELFSFSEQKPSIASPILQMLE